MRQTKPSPFFISTLMLACSFTFAFLLGEMVHEYGHYFSHLAFGNHAVGVYLNPFGSSRMVGVTSDLPIRQMGLTSAAGPLTDLVLALVLMLALWRIQRPILLPLLLWGPVAMIQEGVNFSLGLLTPGGDAAWISTLGFPKPLILAFGILLIFAGLLILSALLTSMGMTAGQSPFRTFLMVFLGMCTLLLIRFIYSTAVQPEFFLENLIPFVFSLLLAALLVLLQPLSRKIFHLVQPKIPSALNTRAILTAVFLAAGIFLVQLIMSMTSMTT